MLGTPPPPQPPAQGGHVLCMLCRPGLSPNEHPLKQLDKNQCSNKGKLIIPSSALAEIITLDRRRRLFRGRGADAAGTRQAGRPLGRALRAGPFSLRWLAPAQGTGDHAPECRAPGTTRSDTAWLRQPRVCPAGPVRGRGHGNAPWHRSLSLPQTVARQPTPEWTTSRLCS